MGQNETANYRSSVKGWAVNVMGKIKTFYHVCLDVITLGHVSDAAAVMWRYMHGPSLRLVPVCTIAPVSMWQRCYLKRFLVNCAYSNQSG